MSTCEHDESVGILFMSEIRYPIPRRLIFGFVRKASVQARLDYRKKASTQRETLSDVRHVYMDYLRMFTGLYL